MKRLALLVCLIALPVQAADRGYQNQTATHSGRRSE